MRVLITGAAGFIGSHLCDALLEHGDEVIGIDNLITGLKENLSPLVEFIKMDVQELPWLRTFQLPRRFDRIYHLACPASPVAYQAHPFATITTAFEGTHAVLRAKEAHAKLLIASTSEVYGDPLESPQKETYWGNVNPIGSRSCYDEGKRAAEALCVASKESNVVIARIFNTYGPRMRPDDGRVIPTWIRQAASNQAITVQGTGGQTRSFCYVSDTVRGLIALMESDVKSPTFPVNIGRYFPKAIIQHVPPAPDDPARRCPDISRAKKYLNWESQIPFEEGLQKTIEWALANWRFDG